MKLTQIAVWLAAGLSALPAYADDTFLLSDRRITEPGVMTLGTRTGSEIGLSASFYRYQEPDAGVTEQGPRGAIDYTGTYKFQNGPFLRAELKYSNGPVSYSSASGNQTNPNWYGEFRALIGFDMNFVSYDISPYTGFGYRYLSDNASGVSSIGALGYKRQSQYLYLPLGIIARTHVASSAARLTTNMEFDLLLAGRQKSATSEFAGQQGITSATDLINNQHSGIGLRLSSMYETQHWSVGPYLNYWKIYQSDTSSFSITQGGVTSVQSGYVEPNNNTLEVGIRGAVRF